MLAKPTKGISEVLDRFEGVAFTCEWKYDGERAQVHVTKDGTMKIFSRNSEDTSGKYPDVIQHVKAAAADGTESFVLDGEVVAYDTEKGVLLPFQILSTRARKGASVDDVKVKVIYAAFDVLYHNGESLLRKTLRERRDVLLSAFREVPHQFMFAKAHDGSSTEEISAFLEESVKGNCEGLMVKTLDSDATYEPSKRSLNWLKLKKDYMDGLTDSLDLVPVGAWHGKGKRTGVYGAYLLACYDEESEEWQTITKIGTGFSDEVLMTHTKFFEEKELVTENQPMSVIAGEGTATPDVWFKPGVVWEVKAADLSVSPIYQAAIGKVHPSKGIALRFPRFMRIREDKDADDATNASQVAQMYRDQGLGGTGGGHISDDDI
jgi:DNA ligase-1